MSQGMVEHYLILQNIFSRSNNNLQRSINSTTHSKYQNPKLSKQQKKQLPLHVSDFLISKKVTEVPICENKFARRFLILV